MKRVLTPLAYLFVAVALGTASPAAEKARPAGRARVLAIGGYEGDYAGASKTFQVQQFGLGTVYLLLCVPRDKKSTKPGQPWAVEGRLVLADKEMFRVEVVMGLPTFLMLKGDEKTQFKKILERRAVVLVADKLTEVADRDKARFPAFGKVRIEGKAICAKRDLNVLDEPTLAVENGPLPIVLDGPKARADARGKGILRVTGSLRVDAKRELLRLTADEVQDVKAP
jgi:hypothetical protein